MPQSDQTASAPGGKKQHRALRRVLLAVGLVLLTLLLLVGGYVLYVVLQYSRIPDHTPLPIDSPQSAVLRQGDAYSAVTYNIGFGAYDQTYSFFMDTGHMADGTYVAGTHGTAESLDAVHTNTNGSADALKKLDADFCLIQEADKDATRSYHVNQVQALSAALTGRSGVYASNFHSAFLAYPLNDMHGKTEAGLLTLSRYRVDEAVRRSYPVDGAFPTRFFDLDRCFSVLRLPVQDASGKATAKQLVLINSHMSAYDKGGTIRVQQLALLDSVLAEETAKGNYVIVGGDFNHALYGTENSFPSQQQFPEWVFTLTSADFADGFSIVEAANGHTVPTCRACDIPYTKGVNYTSVLDGFVVSDNITATAENIDLDFLYSDHNPVKISFTLNA
ncbi:MAG: endonuclease/exonuclease/phosphatase family protein [Ruthenibacterium sp.]